MKKEWKWLIALCLIVIVLLPITVVRWVSDGDEKDSHELKIRVLMPDGEVETMGIEKYLIGVVAGEMPAEFEKEALKAQAIAARTYAAKRIKTAVEQQLPYDIDTTIQNQNWISESQMRKKWGWGGFRKYYHKIKKAVYGTKGLVLTADGDLIDSYYHSSSGRKQTERPEEVWSSPRSYLKNVDSGEENPYRYVKQYRYTAEELAQKLGMTSYPQTVGAADIQVISRTAAGRVKTIKIFGKPFQGTELRTLLGLMSTDIEWSINGKEIVFTTYGNGHGVGMSQYGANDMAKKGHNCGQILSHFYPGTSLASLN